MMSSTARVAAGSGSLSARLRNSTSGAVAQARESARRCCSPIEMFVRRGGASGVSPSPRAPRECAPRAVHAEYAAASAHSRYWRRRSAQHHRPLEHHGLSPARLCAARPQPAHFAPAVGASSPWQSRNVRLLPAPLGPRITVRGPLSR
jgi:hypothetical protein